MTEIRVWAPHQPRMRVRVAGTDYRVRARNGYVATPLGRRPNH